MKHLKTIFALSFFLLLFSHCSGGGQLLDNQTLDGGGSKGPELLSPFLPLPSPSATPVPTPTPTPTAEASNNCLPGEDYVEGKGCVAAPRDDAVCLDGSFPDEETGLCPQMAVNYYTTAEGQRECPEGSVERDPGQCILYTKEYSPGDDLENEGCPRGFTRIAPSECRLLLNSLQRGGDLPTNSINSLESSSEEGRKYIRRDYDSRQPALVVYPSKVVAPSDND